MTSLVLIAFMILFSRIFRPCLTVGLTRARYAKRDKYSIQQKAVELATGSDEQTAKAEIVPGSDIEGCARSST